MGRKKKDAAAPAPPPTAPPPPATFPPPVQQYRRPSSGGWQTPVFGILGTVLLFWLVLPALADLTPPGVTPKLLAELAEQQTKLAELGCADACRGMACPAGWTTGRSQKDLCKCICVRMNPDQPTAWDEQRKQQQQAAADATATADAADGGDAGAASTDAAGAATDETPNLTRMRRLVERTQQKQEEKSASPDGDATAGADGADMWEV